MAKIIMIQKKDKSPDLAESYRPISLLSCLSKWLEKIVNEKLLLSNKRTITIITFLLESKNLLPPCEFRKKKSTQDHFLRLYHSIIDGFYCGEKTGAVFFDLAFDKINHNAILFEFKSIKINPYLYNWIAYFLDDRNFFVSYKNAKSYMFKITTGVPQGSSLSQILFSVFFSDIVKKLAYKSKSLIRRRSYNMD